jgi:hypothetical protein
VLSTIIRQNSKCKDILLEIPYEIRTGKPPISFFGCVVRTTIRVLKSKIDDSLVIGLLRLLTEWIHESPNAAKKFMENTIDFLYVSCKFHFFVTLPVDGIGMFK